MPSTTFSNRHPHDQPSLADLLRWTIGRRRHGLPPVPTDPLQPVAPDLRHIHGPIDSDQLTWIGHSTLLLRLNGRTFLTDPHFGSYAAPMPGMGPVRWQPPGLLLSELPPIDVVLISHNHYDHLDRLSLRRIQALNPQVRYLIPRGLDRWFARHLPDAKTASLHWDDHVEMHGVRIIFTAVQHWSKRTLTDTNRSLWGGFVMHAPATRFLFGGDLGYSPACRELGETYGPFDLAAIPVGAYEPRWFMHNQHVDPAQAVQVHLDVRATRSVGIHWGTFHGITDEPLDQPPRDLARARQAAGLQEDDFFLLRHGQTIAIIPQTLSRA